MRHVSEIDMEEVSVELEFDELTEEELDRLEREYLRAQKADNDNNTVTF